MPDHYRQRIREQIVTDVTSLTTTGANAFDSRVAPVEQSKLPCLLVYATDEESEPDEMTRPRGLERVVTIEVVGLARVLDGIEDTLDTIAKEVEAALGNSTLSGLVKDLWLARTRVAFEGEADREHGSVVMEWRAEYRTVENDSTTAA